MASVSEEAKPSETTDMPKPSSSNDNENEDQDNRSFECNICLDFARNAVISLCGHLFCWPCLHQWLETRPQRQICPVCKAGIGRDKVIPLYGRDGDQKDPRDIPIPPRPRGQRPEPESTGMGANVGNMFNAGGFQMSFGIGAFPFGFFATNLNWGNEGNGANHGPSPGSPQYEEEQFLHRIFLWVAFAFMIWLLIA